MLTRSGLGAVLAAVVLGVVGWWWNYEEIVIHQTLPGNPDTDGDEIPDGDEVEITGTSPTSSDALLVDFVRQNLSPEAAGAIALSHVFVQHKR